jgi:hypothetical protein
MPSASTMAFPFSLIKNSLNELPLQSNKKHGFSEDEFGRLSYSLQYKETAPKLVRSSSSDSTSADSSSCSSSSVDSRPLSPPSSRVLFRTYWEKSGARKEDYEDKHDTLENALPCNSCIYLLPCQAHVPTSAANISERRRQILPTFSDKNETHATTGYFSLQYSYCSIDGISSWSRSSMKTYPKSSFRRAEQKRRGSTLKRSITFDPDVQIVEYTKEEMATFSDSWIVWFQ